MLNAATAPTLLYLTLMARQGAIELLLVSV
jgi:hypothetical protein